MFICSVKYFIESIIFIGKYIFLLEIETINLSGKFSCQINQKENSGFSFFHQLGYKFNN